MAQRIFLFFNHLWKRFFSAQKNVNRLTAERLYWEVVAQSRAIDFFKKYDIEDSIDGRFDSLLLHLFPLIDWLNQTQRQEIAQETLNLMIKDMNRSLRNIGVGDPSIARKMRKIGEAYLGRMTAYAEAKEDHAFFKETLFKNMYRSNLEKKDIVNDLLTYVQRLIKSYETYVLGSPLPSLL